MTKPITITDHTGLKLAALFDEPSTPGPHPLVIILHGFTGWKEEDHLVALAEALPKVGIAALRFDAPGSGESEGTWAETYRLTNYLNDVPDVLAFAKASLPVDPDRIAIWGHSMGGFVALAAAARHPRDFKAVCGCQPSNGWKMLSDDRVARWKNQGHEVFSSSRFPHIELPYAFYEDRQQYNALTEVPHLAMPSLFIAGTLDTTVPADGIKKMIEAAPEPKRYREYPANHFYKRDSEILATITADTVKFFSDHLRTV